MKKHASIIIGILIITMLIVTGCPSDPVAVSSVKLDKTEISIELGSSCKLKATTLPSDAEVGTGLKWTSDKPEFATVDTDGNVTAKAIGEATITVTTDNGLKATCKITVKPIVAESIELSSESLEILIGSSTDLTVSFTPENTTDKTIIWESSAPTIAKVENGKVTALSPGQATIKAKAGKLEATCHITAKPIVASSISLNKTAAELEVDNMVTLSVIFNPANTTDKTITWSSDKPEFATVDNSGNVTAVAIGTAVITASSSNGKTATCTVTVKPTEAENIYFMNDVYILEKGENQIDEGLYFNPSTTTDQTATWSSSDDSVVNMNTDGTFQCLKPGTVTITATHKGLTATCTFEVVDHINENAGKLWKELEANGLENATSLRIAGNIDDSDFNGLIYSSTTLTYLDMGLATVKNGKLYGKSGADDTKLITLILPHNLISIPDNFLSGDTTVTSITIPGSVETIRAGAFKKYSHITEIILLEGIKKIDEAAFVGTGLTSITIPASVNVMTDAWPALEKITFKGTEPPILAISTNGTNAPVPPDRTWMENAKVYVPEESMNAYTTSAWFKGDLYRDFGAQPCFDPINLHKDTP